MSSIEKVPEDPVKAWDRVATGFDAHVTPKNMVIAEEALRRAGLRQSARLLDVAAGSGALSIPAARRGAEVLATDISPIMVERLHDRARKAGLSNLESRVMDGQALELEDASFDVAASQFGVMLFPDMPRGLAEMARVTKPGGRVVTVSMGAIPEVEVLKLFVGTLEATLPGFQAFPEGPPTQALQLADPAVHRRALETAGLEDVHVEEANYPIELENAAEWWGWFTSSNPIGAGIVADLTQEERAAAQKALGGALRKRAGGDDPAVLNNGVYIGVGTKN